MLSPRLFFALLIRWSFPLALLAGSAAPARAQAVANGYYELDEKASKFIHEQGETPFHWEGKKIGQAEWSSGGNGFNYKLHIDHGNNVVSDFQSSWSFSGLPGKVLRPKQKITISGLGAASGDRQSFDKQDATYAKITVDGLEVVKAASQLAGWNADAARTFVPSAQTTVEAVVPPYRQRTISIRVRASHFYRTTGALDLLYVYNWVEGAPPDGDKPADPPELEFLDANPQYLDQLFDFTNPHALRESGSMENYLARARHVALQANHDVIGAAADGVSMVLLRAKVKAKGSVRFSLDGPGELFHIGDTGAKPGPSELKVTTFPLESPEQSVLYAACLYRPPSSFGEDLKDKRFKVRVSFIPAQAGGQEASAHQIFQLTRPPVVLVHGTFDNPKYCWETRDVKECGMPLAPLLESRGYRPFKVDWREANGQKNPSSFFHNRKAVWENKGGIRDALDALRADRFAATQVDIVAHSQGGLITRMYAKGQWAEAGPLALDDVHYTDTRTCSETCAYHRPDNFARGDIHRLITVSTTHYGSDICRLFEVFRQLRDYSTTPEGAAFLSDRWEQLSSDLILSLHPQREIPTELFPDWGGVGGLPADFGLWSSMMSYPGLIPKDWRMVDLGKMSMIMDGLTKFLSGHGEFVFTEGFQAQIPRSEALRGLGVTRIPSHAIACTASADDMLNLNNGFYQQRVAMLWYLATPAIIDEAFRRMGQNKDADDLSRLKQEEKEQYFDRLVVLNADALTGSFGLMKEDFEALTREYAISSQENVARLRAATFGNTPNDCTVRQDSSFGGLKPPYTTVIPGVLHGPAPQFPAVQERILALLADDGKLFAPDGFPPAGILPKNQPYVPTRENTPSFVRPRGDATDGARKEAATSGGPAHKEATLDGGKQDDMEFQIPELRATVGVKDGHLVVTHSDKPTLYGVDTIPVGSRLSAVIDSNSGDFLELDAASLPRLKNILCAPDANGRRVSLEIQLPDGGVHTLSVPGRFK